MTETSASRPVSATEATAPERSRLRNLVELALPVGVLVWRASSRQPGAPWHDWTVVVSLYWAFSIFADRTRAWPWVTLAVMGGLLAVYFQHQAPLMLERMGSAW